MIPLEYLRMLQDILGNEYQIQDAFDIAAGTSSGKHGACRRFAWLTNELGGLIVLITFLYHWSPERRSAVFDSVARKVFTQQRTSSTGVLAKIQRGLKCWMSDGRYDEKTIAACLKDVFGETMTMFTSGQSGTKLAITATSISDAKCFIFTNYNTGPAGHFNGLDTCPNSLMTLLSCGAGYWSAPHGDPLKEPLVWEMYVDRRVT